MTRAPPTLPLPESPEALARALGEACHLVEPPTAMALWLALRLDRPLLVEGPAGVGKTDLARAAAEALSRPLIRLQCYEGLDEAKALYEWDHAKQMLYTQLLRDAVARETASASTLLEAVDRIAASGAAFYGERFLIPRPLLAALRSERPAVLLLDEVDRADPEFEAFLLEVLGEFQITIPELGTVRAAHRPLVLLTTNATREMTEALRRRCLHAFLDYPSPARELEIVRARVPEIDVALGRSLVQVVGRLRRLELRKAPALSETLDWARSLILLRAGAVDRDVLERTLGVLLKHDEDRDRALDGLEALLEPRPGAG